MTDSRNFLLSTDYPLDKVVYMTSGSFTATGGGGTGTQYQFNHGLPFRPLIIGTWSLNSNFSTSREGGQFTAEGTDPNTVYSTFYANNTQITIDAFNPGSTVTIYYRIYGLMPSDVNVDASFTSANADSFVLNTGYNYTKLHISGVSAASASTTVTHSLGYRPQVTAWLVDKSGAYDATAVVEQGYVTVTTSTIVITSPSYDVHYRVYADGQI